MHGLLLCHLFSTRINRYVEFYSQKLGSILYSDADPAVYLHVNFFSNQSVGESKDISPLDDAGATYTVINSNSTSTSNPSSPTAMGGTTPKSKKGRRSFIPTPSQVRARRVQGVARGGVLRER